MFKKPFIACWSKYVCKKDGQEVRIDYIDGKMVGFCRAELKACLSHSELPIKKFLRQYETVYSRPSEWVKVPPFVKKLPSSSQV